jgi:hypothetical protein
MKRKRRKRKEKEGTAEPHARMTRHSIVLNWKKKRGVTTLLSKVCWWHKNKTNIFFKKIEQKG